MTPQALLGRFTLGSIFAEFSGFFRQRHESLPADRVANLGIFVSECMALADVDLGNAAATCFVENAAGEECDRELARHLSARRLERAKAGRQRYRCAWRGRRLAGSVICGGRERTAPGAISTIRRGRTTGRVFMQ
jgi:hypothetical protein